MLLSDSGREGSSALEEPGSRPGPLRKQVDQFESRLLREALERNDWNQTRTAAELRLSRQGLIKKLQRYGLGKAGRRSSGRLTQRLIMRRRRERDGLSRAIET